jgi:hypothetical protein
MRVSQPSILSPASLPVAKPFFLPANLMVNYTSVPHKLNTQYEPSNVLSELQNCSKHKYYTQSVVTAAEPGQSERVTPPKKLAY